MLQEYGSRCMIDLRYILLSTMQLISSDMHADHRGAFNQFQG